MVKTQIYIEYIWFCRTLEYKSCTIFQAHSHQTSVTYSYQQLKRKPGSCFETETLRCSCNAANGKSLLFYSVVISLQRCNYKIAHSSL